SELGVRTRRVAEVLAGRIMALDGSIEKPQAWTLAAETIQVATGSKVEVPKRSASKENPEPESKYLMFLSAHQLQGLAELAVKAHGAGKDFFKDKATKDLARQIANTRHSVDIA